MNQFLKNVVLLVLALLIGAVQWLVALGGLLYWLPLSLQPVKPLALDYARQETGLSVDWSDGYMRLSRGAIVIDEPLVELPRTPGERFAAQSLRIDISPLPEFSAPFYKIDSMALDRPQALQARITEEGLRLEPPLQNIISEMRVAGKIDSVYVRPAPLTIQNASLSIGSVREERYLPAISLGEVNVVLKPTERGGMEATFNGDLKSRTAAQGPAHGSLQGVLITEDFRSYAYRGSLDRLSLMLDERDSAISGESMFVENVTISGTVNTGGEAWNIENTIGADTFRFVDPVDRIRIEETSPRVSGDLNYAPRENRLSWERGTYESASGRIVSSGTTQLETPLQLELGAKTEKISGEMVRLLLARHGMAQWDVKLRRGGALAVDGRVFRNGAEDLQTSGSVSIEGLFVRSPNLPLPFDEIRGRITFGRDGISCPGIEGQFGEGRFNLTGEAAGTIFQRQAGRATIHIDAQTNLRDFRQDIEQAAGTLADRPTSRPIDLSGRVITSGTFDIAWPKNPRPEDYKVEASGRVQLEEVYFSHPSLPVPLEGIHGMLKGTNDRLEIVNLTGKKEGIDVSVLGHLEGERFFWRDPRVQATVVCDVVLPEALDAGLEELQILEDLKYYHPRGESKFEVELAGPAYRPRDWTLSSFLTLQDISIDSPITWIVHPLTQISGRLSLEDDRIVADKIGLMLGKIPLQLEGLVSRRTVDLTLSFRTAIEHVKDTFPIFFFPFRMEGMVDGFMNLKFQHRRVGPNIAPMALRGESEEGASSVKLLEAAGEKLAEDIEEGEWPYRYQLNGQFVAEGITFTPLVFPVELEDIRGTAHIENNKVYWEDATGTVGNSKDVRLDGEIVFRPPDWPKMTFDLTASEVVLDDWLTGWNPAPTPTTFTVSQSLRTPSEIEAEIEPRGVPREEKPERQGDIYVNVSGEEIRYLQYRGENASFKLHHEAHRHAPSVLKIWDAGLEGYQGRMDLECELQFQRDNPMRYEMTFRPEGIDLPELLTAITQEENETKGRLGGDLLLTGNSSSLDTMRGEGQITVTESQFFGNIMLRELGRALNIVPYMDRIKFTEINALFHIREQTVHFEPIKFDALLLDIVANGDVGFDKSLAFDVELGFHKPEESENIFQELTWNQVMNVISSLSKKTFNFQLSGTLDDPKYRWQPYSEEQQALLDTLNGTLDLIPTDKLFFWQNGDERE